MTAATATQPLRLIAARVNRNDFVTIRDAGDSILRIGLVSEIALRNCRVEIEWADGGTSTLDPQRIVEVS